MKLTGVKLVPGGTADDIALSFRDPRRLLPYRVSKIDGLDADEIIARFYSAPGNSSAKFYNLSLQSREVALTIDLMPNFATSSYSDLRDDLYRMISATRTGLIDVVFMNELVEVAKISGHVTKLNTDLFESDQQVTLHINCAAGETLLRAPNMVEVDIDGVSPANTVVTDALSTAPHGFEFVVAFLNPLASFRISDAADPLVYFEVTPTGGFQQYDLLSFSSDPADKYAMIIRGVTPVHIADKISRSTWPIIRPGVNTFVCTNPTDLEWVSISHRPTYWGV